MCVCKFWWIICCHFLLGAWWGDKPHWHHQVSSHPASSSPSLYSNPSVLRRHTPTFFLSSCFKLLPPTLTAAAAAAVVPDGVAWCCLEAAGAAAVVCVWWGFLRAGARVSRPRDREEWGGSLPFFQSFEQQDLFLWSLSGMELCMSTRYCCNVWWVWSQSGVCGNVCRFSTDAALFALGCFYSIYDLQLNCQSFLCEWWN